VGTVLGVAGLIAILSRVSAADPIPAYRNGLVLVIAFFAAAGVVSAVTLGGRPGGRLSGRLSGRLGAAAPDRGAEPAQVEAAPAGAANTAPAGAGNTAPAP
jgi:hypothetical protein